MVGREANAETLGCHLAPEDLKEMRTPQCGGSAPGEWTVSVHLAAPGVGILVVSRSPCLQFPCREIGVAEGISSFPEVMPKAYGVPEGAS